MGANTLTRLDHVVIARYFTFMVNSQLIIFTVIGVVYSKSFLWLCVSYRLSWMRRCYSGAYRYITNSENHLYDRLEQPQQ